MFKVGDIVEYLAPEADEQGVTYRVLEMNGDRCFIQAVAHNGAAFDMPILPQTVAQVAWLKVAA